MRERNAVYITTHALFNALLDPPTWARRLEAIDDRHAVPGVVYGRFKQMVRPGAEEARAALVTRLRASLKKVLDAGVLIAARKLADLVVLDADPLADISDVRRVHRVVKRASSTIRPSCCVGGNDVGLAANE